MDRPSSRAIAALLALTFTTGMVDAASVVGLHRVFTGNMTGNLLLAGFAAAGTYEVSIASSLIAVAGFFSGAVTGARVVSSHDRIRGGIAVELLLLLVAFAVPPSSERAELFLLAAALGMQSAVARRIAVPDLSTVVLTSTIVGIATEIGMLRTDAPLLRRGLALASMVAGAIAGALLVKNGVRWPVGTAACVVALVLVMGGSNGQRSVLST